MVLVFKVAGGRRGMSPGWDSPPSTTRVSPNRSRTLAIVNANASANVGGSAVLPGKTSSRSAPAYSIRVRSRRRRAGWARSRSNEAVACCSDPKQDGRRTNLFRFDVVCVSSRDVCFPQRVRRRRA